MSSQELPTLDPFDDPDRDPWFDCADPDCDQEPSMPLSSSGPIETKVLPGHVQSVQSDAGQTNQATRKPVPKHLTRVHKEQQRAEELARVVNNLKAG